MVLSLVSLARGQATSVFSRETFHLAVDLFQYRGFTNLLTYCGVCDSRISILLCFFAEIEGWPGGSCQLKAHESSE